MLVIAPCNDFIDNHVLREYSIGNEFFEGT
jgi:hypothetical protein